jgi:hypothetical protein
MPKSSKQKNVKKATAAKKPTPDSSGGKPTTNVVKPAPAPVIKDDPTKSPMVLPAKRKLGLRGAAPWAARHAAKHAAEARARAAEPAPPGSARATIRVPTGAEEIKAKIAELHTQIQKIRNLRKRLDKGFFDIGVILGEVQQQELYLAKGYGSFEAFLEREIDLGGKQIALKLIKIAHLFQREAALDYGMDRVLSAVAALEGEATMAKPSQPSTPGVKPLPLKPPMRIVG